jgi:hypothetical protein
MSGSQERWRGLARVGAFGLALGAAFVAPDLAFWGTIGWRDAVYRLGFGVALAFAARALGRPEQGPRSMDGLEVLRHAAIRAVLTGVVVVIANNGLLAVRALVLYGRGPDGEMIRDSLGWVAKVAILAVPALAVELLAKPQRSFRRDALLVACLVVVLTPLHLVSLAQYNYARGALATGSFEGGLAEMRKYALLLRDNWFIFLDGAIATAIGFAAIVVVRLRRLGGVAELAAVLLTALPLGITAYTLERLATGLGPNAALYATQYDFYAELATLTLAVRLATRLETRARAPADAS